jgi:hypothetical protein
MPRRDICEPVSEAEYEEMPDRIEAAFDRVRDLLPQFEDDE